jgi:hypothetical protein
VVRQEFEKGKKVYLGFVKDKTQFGCYSKGEVYDFLREKNYLVAFDAIDSDRYDQQTIWKIAESNLSSARRKKFTPKMRPFDEYANSSFRFAA